MLSYCLTRCNVYQAVLIMLYQYFVWTHVWVSFYKKGKHCFWYKWVWFSYCYSCQMWVCICKIFFKNVIEEWFSSNAFVYMFKEYSLVYHRRRQAFTKMFVHIVHMLQLQAIRFTPYKTNLDFLFLPNMPNKIHTIAGQHLPVNKLY